MGIPLSKNADVVASNFSNPLNIIMLPMAKPANPIILRRSQSRVFRSRRFPREKKNNSGRKRRKALIYLRLAISNGERSSRRIFIKGGDIAQMRTK
jgi:hypothetical protein